MDYAALACVLKTNSAASAAKMFGVHRRTFYSWCKRLGITRRVYGCPNPGLLRRLEAESTLQRDIARRFNVSRWTIARWCKKLGILHHTTGRFRVGTKGNQPHIHEEMPFGIGVAFSDDLDWA
jgi:hypothetical protein